MILPGLRIEFVQEEIDSAPELRFSRVLRGCFFDPIEGFSRCCERIEVAGEEGARVGDARVSQRMKFAARFLADFDAQRVHGFESTDESFLAAARATGERGDPPEAICEQM